MKHLLANADGEILWEGDPTTADGASSLRKVIYDLRNNAATRERRASRIALGLCVDCGQACPMKTETRCWPCAEEHAAGQSDRRQSGKA